MIHVCCVAWEASEIHFKTEDGSGQWMAVSVLVLVLALAPGNCGAPGASTRDSAHAARWGVPDFVEALSLFLPLFSCGGVTVFISTMQRCRMIVCGVWQALAHSTVPFDPTAGS